MTSTVVSDGLGGTEIDRQRAVDELFNASREAFSAPPPAGSPWAIQERLPYFPEMNAKKRRN